MITAWLIPEIWTNYQSVKSSDSFWVQILVLELVAKYLFIYLFIIIIININIINFVIILF